MYLDLWKALRNRAFQVHNYADLLRIMNELEQRALDEAKFEKHPYKALRHLRRIHLYGIEEEEAE